MAGGMIFPHLLFPPPNKASSLPYTRYLVVTVSLVWNRTLLPATGAHKRSVTKKTGCLQSQEHNYRSTPRLFAVTEEAGQRHTVEEGGLQARRAAGPAPAAPVAGRQIARAAAGRAKGKSGTKSGSRVHLGQAPGMLHGNAAAGTPSP